MANYENNDYYKALQDQNYKALLDKEIQLDNARQRALKNTNVNLAAAGFDSSGFGQLAKSGIEGQYLQGLQNSQNAFQEQTSQNIQDTQNYLDNSFKNFANEMYAYDLSSQDKINNFLNNYGLLGENGALNEQAFIDKYGENNLGAFKQTLDEYGAANASASNGGAINVAGQVSSEIQSKIKDELNFISSTDGRKYLYDNLKAGDYIKISDNTKDKNHAYFKFDGTQFVPVEESEYKGGENQYWLRSREGSKSMIIDHNGKTYYKGVTSPANTGTLINAILTALGFGNPMGAVGEAIGNTSVASKQKKENEKNLEEYLKALQGNN